MKILGLDSGASPDDVRAAFRRIARELHPDVTGSKSEFRFKQVTGAYNALKGLTAEELGTLGAKNTLYDYYKAEKKRRSEAAKIDSILDKYEGEIKNYYENYASNSEIDIKAIVLRLKSKNYKALNVILKHSGHVINRVEFRKALTEILRGQEIHESTAEIIASMPFDDTTRKLLALDVSGNAGNLPTGLIISLAGSDSDVIESFLLHVRPENAGAILRRWPAGKVMNVNVLRGLLGSDDAKILVPLLAMMKTQFPEVSAHYKKRLTELEYHSSPAVRAWAKKLC